MNVFEDLVVELQEENLLERTVMDDYRSAAHDPLHVTEEPVSDPSPPESVDAAENTENEYEDLSVAEHHAEEVSGESLDADASPLAELDEPDVTEEAHLVEPSPVADAVVPPQAESARRGKEFFKKRAVGEVSSLQMVEHVLTGVEREYMKVVPAVFDDLNAKKALHAFLQVAENSRSEEHAQAEFDLMHETEAWCTALATRDKNISVANLRRYCENSKPALSSQAMLALARFYRNLPYSEAVRGKFDFIITRLFSKATDIDTRKLLFTRDEMLGHINVLYSEWSSVPLYAADDDDESNIMLTALSFEDLSIEAEKAETFDQLIASDYFGRLRLFKESIAELFFAPIVTAAAIECNIRIGNAYVILISREREKMDAESIQSKYGDLNDQTISEAAGRTLELVEMLRSKSAPAEESEYEDDEVVVYEQTLVAPAVQETSDAVSGAASVIQRLKRNALAVNKWFLILSVVLVIASMGVYVWANYFVTDSVASTSVKNVDIEGSFMKEYVKTARISGENLYAVLLPTWDGLSKEKRQEFLQKVYQAGKEKGYTQVNLISGDGKMVGFASAARVDVQMP